MKDSFCENQRGWKGGKRVSQHGRRDGRLGAKEEPNT